MPLRRRTGLLTSLALPTALAAGGCAKPCVDDGLGQEFCPENDDQGNSGTGTDDADTAGSMGDGPETGGNDGNQCPILDVVLTPQVPTIQIVVDQSGSMNQDFGGVTRWEAISDTLVGSPDAVVNRLQSDIRFGVTLYSGNSTTCPQITEIPPRLDASNDVATLFADNAPLAETPTGESFEIAAANLAADTWDGDKFIVLATDGEPDSCADPNPASGSPEAEATRQLVVDAVAAAFANGIPTFVVSVGNDVADEHLQEVANAGAGVGNGDPDAPFFKALDEQALTAAFAQIVSGVRECKLDLAEPLLPELASSCDVTVNSESIPYDDPNGWRLDGDATIELQGDACTQIQDGFVAIAMTCSCEVTQ